MRGYSLLHRLERDQNKRLLYGIAGYPCLNILKSMEIQSGHSELSIMSQVSVFVKRGSTVLHNDGFHRMNYFRDAAVVYSRAEPDLYTP